MSKLQLTISLVAVGLAVLLFQFPRSVVENEQLQEVTTISTHSMEIPPNVQEEIVEVRTLLKREENVNKKSSFAFSLAKKYLDYGVLDSAEVYADHILKWEGETSEKSAEIYFTAYERSSSVAEGVKFARKAEQILTQLLEKNPTHLFLKNRLAMTLVASDNPMVGINMLREIAAEDPNNRQAILNLGLLAIQSGQFERAKERFETLTSLDSTDSESKLYLAVTMIETNKPKQARLLLEKILATQDSIPAIKLMANDYLNLL
ncbi:MAG: tetratricopeptide repeat protein [Ekhidna sp.]|nr:tetratricopeptide repeat protein [Ekhidna sp.]MBC6425393.1 tetratricopeptide repeat protein [Ekhidna sp.]